MKQTTNSNWRWHIGQRLLTLGAILVLIWVIEIVDWLFWGGRLDQYGIRPRTLIGLRNIAFAPLLHAGFGHLLANTLPFLVLGWFVTLHGLRAFWRVTLVAALVSGAAIWLFAGSRSVHLGLSGVIFGYLGYLLARGYRERSLLALVLALLALIFYGGMLWGLVSWQPGVSWLGHLFGFIGGILAANGSPQASVALDRNFLNAK